MEPEKKSNGAFIGLTVIIIILIIGGIYIWQSNKKTTSNEETVNSADSVELSNLEADLNAADINTGVDVNSVE